MLWDNLNKALCNITTSRGMTKGSLKLGNLMSEGWWPLWCEDDLSWKSVSVLGAPEQGARLTVWEGISLASIQGKYCPVLPMAASPQPLCYPGRNRLGGGTAHQRGRRAVRADSGAWQRQGGQGCYRSESAQRWIQETSKSDSRVTALLST